MLCLSYLQMHSHLEQGSKKQTLAPLFCIGPISPLFSRWLPCFLSCLRPPGFQHHGPLLILFSSFSQLTGWHTLLRTKSPSEKTQENTHAHTWEHKCMHVIICKHMHAQWDADTSLSHSVSLSLSYTQANTRTKRQTCIHTQARTSKVLQCHAFPPYT